MILFDRVQVLFHKSIIECVINSLPFLRSYSGLPDLLYHLTYVTQTRYTGAIFNEIEFYNKTSLVSLMWVNETSQQKFRCEGNTFGFGCRSVFLPPTKYFVKLSIRAFFD